MNYLNLDEKLMAKLSFPDRDVLKMEFDPFKKLLTIHVEGAFLDVEDGIILEEGVLYFEEWESIFIDGKDYTFESEYTTNEFLNDICTADFINNEVKLCGYGKHDWMEWTIINPKMHATFKSSMTFEEYRKIYY